jgi:hypothetical protein
MLAETIGAIEPHTNDWVRAHEALSRLARQRALADAEEERWLLAALRSAAHVHLGFGAFGEYIERLFGYGRRCIQEKLRVAEALEELPALARALESGVLPWSAIREITRVAVPETEAAWLDVAKGKTSRQLEDLVAGKHPGDTPTTPADPSARRHVLRFDVSAETLALFREALGELRRRTGSSLDDDAALFQLARHVLGGPTDDARASYQIALTVCAACRAGHQDGGGDPVAVDADIIDMASCDGQHIGHVGVRPANDAARGPMPSAVESGAPATDAAHEAGGLTDSAGTPQAGAHVDAPARAKQDVPPAVRRMVLRRDDKRCRVPSCRNVTYLDLHHIVPRSEGGPHHAENILTLCGAHHRAIHRGELAVEGNARVGVRFRHADGTPYGDRVQPRALDVQAKVFGALRGLGFREGEIRRVFAAFREEDGFRGATAECWLRAAIQRLTAPASEL